MYKYRHTNIRERHSKNVSIEHTNGPLRLSTVRKLHNEPCLKLERAKLQVVEENRFLFFIKKNSVHSPFKFLKTKYNKSLHHLCVVAYNEREGDRLSLMKSYRSLLHSNLDYASFIYGGARISYLKILSATHYQGLRFLLGTFRTS